MTPVVIILGAIVAVALAFGLSQRHPTRPTSPFGPAMWTSPRAVSPVPPVDVEPAPAVEAELPPLPYDCSISGAVVEFQRLYAKAGGR